MGGMVISGGRVVDPASGTDAVADMAVRDGKIAAIGTELGDAERTIDATGLVVAPPFHRPPCVRPVDPSRPHAGLRQGDNDAAPGSRVLPVASWYRRQAARTPEPD